MFVTSIGVLAVFPDNSEGKLLKRFHAERIARHCPSQFYSTQGQSSSNQMEILSLALFTGYSADLFKVEISEPEKEKQDKNESKTEELRK